jgi:predicted esterase
MHLKHLGIVALTVAVALEIVGPETQHSSAAGPSAASADRGQGIVAWCANGLEPIAGGGCFAEPSDPKETPVPLVVYLHGRYPASVPADELDRQARVARLANERGYAALALRGIRGQCTDPRLANYICWPSNERNEGDGPAFVARWETAFAAVEQRIGSGPRLLFGFSNGGYFATMIATRALASFDAVAIAHAGPVAPTRALGAKTPILLITADDDPSNDEMRKLSNEFTLADWPANIVTRESGFGHALPDWDISMALTFFERARTEDMPLDPPLSR